MMGVWFLAASVGNFIGGTDVEPLRVGLRAADVARGRRGGGGLPVVAPSWPYFTISPWCATVKS